MVKAVFITLIKANIKTVQTVFVASNKSLTQFTCINK